MTSSSTIQFCALGGGCEVGANSFLVSLNGHQVLLDCGTHPKKDGAAALPAFDLLPRRPDACVITHGHVDHCGAAPHLARMFPGIKWHATSATARIMDRMLHNSVSVMETISKERGISDYPLYEHEDVGYFLRTTEHHDFMAPFPLPFGDGAEAMFIEAGHVLGGGSVLLRAPGHTLFYTGDICRTRQHLMGGCRPFPKGVHVDTLVIESTQGATDDDGFVPYREEIERLADALNATLQGGGCVLIPSFALGRTQEIANIVAELQERNRIPFTPIYTAGLGRAIYEVYQAFSDQLMPHAELRPLRRFERLGNLWEPGEVRRVLREPCVIVATSGMMMENTPSALLAQEMIRHEHHGIFFAGYLDQDTPGYKLLHAPAGTPVQLELNRPPVEKVLENVRQFRFSAHATRSELADIVERIQPENVVYIHGDPDAVRWMEENTGSGRRTFMPEVGQVVTLEA